MRWGFWLNLQNNYFDYIWFQIFAKNMKIFLETLCIMSINSLIFFWTNVRFFFIRLFVVGIFWCYTQVMLEQWTICVGTIWFCFFHTVNSSTITDIILLMWHKFIGNSCIQTAFMSRYKLALLYHFCYLDTFYVFSFGTFYYSKYKLPFI